MIERWELDKIPLRLAKRDPNGDLEEVEVIGTRAELELREKVDKLIGHLAPLWAWNVDRTRKEMRMILDIFADCERFSTVKHRGK